MGCFSFLFFNKKKKLLVKSCTSVRWTIPLPSLWFASIHLGWEKSMWFISNEGVSHFTCTSQNIRAIAVNWTTFDCVNLIILRASFYTIRSNQPLFSLLRTKKIHYDFHVPSINYFTFGNNTKKSIIRIYGMFRLILLLIVLNSLRLAF